MKSDPAAARPAPPSASLGAHLGSDLGIDGALARLDAALARLEAGVARRVEADAAPDDRDLAHETDRLDEVADRDFVLGGVRPRGPGDHRQGTGC